MMEYDNMMDWECVNLCDAMNSLPGIITDESCCGHGRNPFIIYFRAETTDALVPILKELDSGQRWNWSVQVGWASGSTHVYFWLIGPTHNQYGADAYFEANELATVLRGKSNGQFTGPTRDSKGGVSPGVGRG